MRTFRRALKHLRWFESAQILVPGFVGILSQRSFPDWVLVLLYAVAYFTHVLSVYSYNDYCDYESDSFNPRKAATARKSKTWLRNQTLVLIGIFLVSMSFMPSGVVLLLVVSQLVCMAYSHPRIRLKGRLLGSELAHFVTGFSYFFTGVLLAGGEPRNNLLGGLLFGLLYLSGGTFNEIMDCDSDRETGLEHLVVMMGKRSASRLVFSLHTTAFALLALYEPSPPVLISCAAAVVVYAITIRGLVHEVDRPERLLQFRRRYRLIFAILLVILSVSRSMNVTGASIQKPVAVEESRFASFE